MEAGAVGNREVVGVNAFMGGRETNQTEYVVQIEGERLEMEASHYWMPSTPIKRCAMCS